MGKIKLLVCIIIFFNLYSYINAQIQLVEMPGCANDNLSSLFVVKDKPKYLLFEESERLVNKNIFPYELVIQKNENGIQKCYDFHFYEYKKEMINKFVEIVIRGNTSEEIIYEAENIEKIKGKTSIKLNGVVGNPYGANVENPSLFLWIPDNNIFNDINLQNFKVMSDGKSIITQYELESKIEPEIFEINIQKEEEFQIIRFFYFEKESNERINNFVQVIKEEKENQVIYEKQNINNEKGDFSICINLDGHLGNPPIVHLWY